MILDKTYEQAFKVFENRYDDITNSFLEEMDDIYDTINSGYYMEAVSNTIVDKLMNWLANVITEIRRFISDIKNSFTHEAKDIGYSVKLSAMEKSLKTAKKEGKKSVQMTDYKKLQSEYIKYRDEIKDYAEKFIKMRYTSTIDLEDDLKKFNDICEKYDKRLDQIASRPITINIYDAIRFVESEKTANSLVIDNLNDLAKYVSEIRDIANNTLKNEELLGSTTLTRKDNRNDMQKLKDASTKVKNGVTLKYHRITDGICKFTRKHVSRMIFKVVLFTS